MTHPLTFQRKAMDIFLAFMMITSFPWIALGGRNHRTHQFEQNSINSISKTEGGNYDNLGVTSDWVKISSGPPSSVITNAGESLTMECEVLGSPPPDVKWLKDGKIFYPSEQQDIGNYAMQGLFEGNEVGDVDGNSYPGEADVLRHITGGLVKVTSRLHIPCVTSRHQGVYTCLATLPSSSKTPTSHDDQINKFPQTALTSSIVQVQEVRRTKGCPSASQERLRREGAWVQEWLPVMMQTIGKGVVLSCRAEGHPKPTVSWLDTTGKIIPTGDSSSARHRVLPTGELFIRELVWEDMGGYTCLVQNSIGKASETTFLYPVRSEDQS
ncbi:neural/ectodermal development factor IMP-L2 [Ischnura elegans]|uniref:neural/ectodermal development factor IMP-L2 n=1 Tax=Ischnura elegans TaxID=197161 RepID=UPI001ED890FB|nr:neural/ectodermal development factor IMP-L2 [Ischnura elegans]